MNDCPISVLLDRLESVTGFKPIRNTRGWTARCPAHDDKRPSLTVSEGADGRALVYCHAGCTSNAVVSALGWKLRDLMPADALTVDNTRRNGPRRKISSTETSNKFHKTYPTAHDAVAGLERLHGPRSAWWTYTGDHGQPVGVVVRWDTPKGKSFRPVSRKGSGWVIGAMPTPRPLYHLHELAQARCIYIAEGEKAADALRELGLTATTSPHGSMSAASTDWSPLAGKLCVIVPDADDAGKRYADDVTERLARLSPAPTVKRVELPDLPLGGDAVEYIATQRTAGLDDDAICAKLERLADAAESVELDRPTPATDRYLPFPVDALPEPLRSSVAKSAQAVGCDPSYVALPMLSALASAIGNTRRIQLKRGWTEPAIIWTAIIGESGTLKTPAFKLVMQPIHDRQGEALKRHAEAQAKYEAQALQYERALALWKRSKASNDDPPEKPRPPQAVRYVVSDTTVEALAPILMGNPRGLLLARDELAGWIRGFDAYKAGRGGDAQHWLSMHNAESIVVDRKTGQHLTVYVPSAAVSVTGGVQPGILDRVLGYEHRESGLLARLLLAMPPRTARRWTEAEISATTEATIRMVFDRLFGLEPDRDENGNLEARIVMLTPAGKRAWVAFYNEHAQEHINLTGDLSAAWSKLEGYAARLALVMHLIRWAARDPSLRDPDAMDETSIAAGVRLSRWFGHEARRVYGVLVESDDDRDRRRLVELIQRKGGSVTPRDLMRSSRTFRTATDAEAALDELAKGGYGRWEQNPPGPQGGKPSKRFVLLGVDGADVDNTPAGDPDKGGNVNVNSVNTAENACDAGVSDHDLHRDDSGPAAPPSNTGMTFAQAEAFEERAAIMEYDGGMARALAEAEAAADTLRSLDEQK